MRGPTIRRRSLTAGAVLTLVITMTAPASAVVPPLPNPPLPDVCGLDVALVLDTSNSIVNDDPANPIRMRDAADLVVDSLAGTPSRIGVFSFRTLATVEHGFADVTDESQVASLHSAIGQINFATAGVDDPNPGGTNWEAGFEVVPSADVIIFATDGNPTTRNDDIINDPGLVTDLADIDAGITASNAHRGSGTTVIGVGIGNAINIANLILISGPHANRDYYATDFESLGATLRDVALRLCGASVTVTKFVDGTPTPGWEFSASTPAGPVDSNPPGNLTDGSGTLNYKIDSPASVTIDETLQPGYVLSNVQCTEGGQPIATSPSPSGNGVVVPVGFDDIILCDFHNTSLTASIALVKTPDTTVARVGDTVTYTYEVTNTGSATVESLDLSDDVLGPIALAETTLAPGASTTGTASVVVTEAMLPGPIENLAVVTGTAPAALNPDVSAEDDASVDLAALAVEKSADTDLAELGDTITYTYVVTNIGSAPLTGVVVNDDLLGPIDLQTTDLAPGQSTTGTATKVVTALELGGSIVNVAVATGTDPLGNPVTDTDTVTVPVQGAPDFTVVKTANHSVAVAGDTIVYIYTITNTGPIALENLTLVDDQLGPLALETTSLQPGESTTATASVVVTASSLPGPIDNVAVATATAPGSDTPLERRDEASVPLAGLRVVKTSDVSTADVGDTVTYTFAITNIGSTTIENLNLVDDVLGPISLGVTTLGPGDTTTGTASYVVQESDVPGPVTNVAVARGQTEIPDSATGSPREVSGSDTASVAVVAVLADTVTTVAVIAAQATTTTAATQQPLPTTGQDNDLLALTGFGLVVLGAAALLLVRNRRFALATITASGVGGTMSSAKPLRQMQGVAGVLVGPIYQSWVYVSDSIWLWRKQRQRLRNQRDGAASSGRERAASATGRVSRVSWVATIVGLFVGNVVRRR